jgi:hypothetical protein
MSLKHLAEKVKAEGRHGDTELVHMTKGEVAGLQALAESAGGSLTINPKTGQPEAFILASLLPMVFGGVGASMGLGALGTAALGAGIGALTNDENPLMGAVMGGMGGFGGGQLANALGAAGASGTAMGSAIPGQAAAELATTEAAKKAVAAGATGRGSQAAMLAAQNMGAPTAQLASTTLAPSSFAAAGQGIQALGTEGGRAAFMDSVGGLGGLAKNVGMAGAPLIAGMMPRGGSGEMPAEEEDTEDLMGRYEYRANPTGGTRTPGSAYSGEKTYFNPEYRRMFAAKGGEVKKYADGGEAAAPSSDAMADPARGMTGESRAAMQYLYDMGQGPGSSGEALDYLYGRAPAAIRAAQAPVQQTPFTPPTRTRSTISDTDGYGLIGSGEYAGLYQGARPQYAFDPGSQQFFRTDPVFKYEAPTPSYDAPQDWSAHPFSEGGLASLARGGMKAGGFVVPADIVSFVGEGNTDAGYERIKDVLPGAVPIKGKDGGQADTVKTSIEGKQPARIAHGEMYVPPAAVKRAGGAKKLYAMMDKVRQQATGNKKQIKPVDVRKALA